MLRALRPLQRQVINPMPNTSPLVVDVVSDIVCPWCYIGKRKLDVALAQLARSEPSLGFSVRWHPFQLNPDLPRQGMPRATYVAQKWGDPARASQNYSRVARAGEAVDIRFRFDLIRTQPNTQDGHRLIAWVQQRGDAGKLVERLFEAFFVEGRSIVDREELARLAAESGCAEEEARAMLASDAFQAEVTSEGAEAIESGIQGVPFFIFNGKTAASGAQEPAALLEAIAAARDAVSVD